MYSLAFGVYKIQGAQNSQVPGIVSRQENKECPAVVQQGEIRALQVEKGEFTNTLGDQSSSEDVGLVLSLIHWQVGLL